jgi:hypothetical protein
MAPENLLMFYWCVVGVELYTSSNMELAHNTTKHFVRTYDEVVNLIGLL